jgi:hypothetical protein
MNLAITADLHLPITSESAIEQLVEEVRGFAPAALLAAGDIGESVADFERCLRLLRRVDCPVLVLPGNHDLWRHDAPSRRLFETVLPDLANQLQPCEWFEGRARVFGGVGIAGTIAWYDYSAADPTARATAREFAFEKRYYNNDAHMIDWHWSDPEFAALVAQPFLAALDRLESDPAVQQVVAVTHVPLLEGQMERKPHDPAWGFSNAYFGNLTLGHEVLKRSKVTHVVSGHTHCGKQRTVRLPDRTVEAYVVPSQYGKPAWLGLELE